MGSKFRKHVIIASILATVYKIWEERNNALWNCIIHTVEKTISKIQYSVKGSVKSRMPRNMVNVDVQWLYSL